MHLTNHCHKRATSITYCLYDKEFHKLQDTSLIDQQILK